MIYLVRHAESEAGRLGKLNGRGDSPLSENGLQQIDELVRKCNELYTGICIEKIYSSPLIRAFLTARGVMEGIGLDGITVLDGLKERDFGIFEGKTIEEAQQIVRPENWLPMENGCGFFLDGPGVESFGSLMTRVQPVYNYLWERSGYSYRVNALVVCHGDVMKAFEAIHREVSIIDVLREGFYENCQIVPLVS